MRLIAAVLLFSFAGSVASGADKDEDKAKEVAGAFLKAVRAKDIDAVMKTVDVPFLMDEQKDVESKTDDLKAAFKIFLENVDPKKAPTDIGMVLDFPAIRKRAEQFEDDRVLKVAKKMVGESGYAVLFERDGQVRGGVLVRINDGQAKVVWVSR